MKTEKTTAQQGKTMGTASKGNSITFGGCEYDKAAHIVRAQVKQGSNSITVSINESVLTELFDCAANEGELKATLTAHQPEISRALLAKIANKQWKVPNKEIVLNVQDLQG